MQNPGVRSNSPIGRQGPGRQPQVGNGLPGGGGYYGPKARGTAGLVLGPGAGPAPVPFQEPVDMSGDGSGTYPCLGKCPHGVNPPGPEAWCLAPPPFPPAPKGQGVSCPPKACNRRQGSCGETETAAGSLCTRQTLHRDKDLDDCWSGARRRRKTSAPDWSCLLLCDTKLQITYLSASSAGTSFAKFLGVDGRTCFVPVVTRGRAHS